MCWIFPAHFSFLLQHEVLYNESRGSSNRTSRHDRKCAGFFQHISCHNVRSYTMNQEAPLYIGPHITLTGSEAKWPIFKLVHQEESHQLHHHHHHHLHLPVVEIVYFHSSCIIELMTDVLLYWEQILCVQQLQIMIKMVNLNGVQTQLVQELHLQQKLWL